jgi:small subunit ribosomal protein S16
VVADSRRARDGKFIEKIGYYDPNFNPSTMEIKSDRVQYWYSKGAQLSDTVRKIAKLKNITLSRKP